MSLIVFEVYDALIEAGTSEAKAKAAAGAIPLAGHLATKDDIGAVRTEIAAVKAELKADIAAVRTEIAAVKAELKADISGLEARLYRQLWLMAAGIVGLTVTLVKLLSCPGAAGQPTPPPRRSAAQRGQAQVGGLPYDPQKGEQDWMCSA